MKEITIRGILSKINMSISTGNIDRVKNGVHFKINVKEKNGRKRYLLSINRNSNKKVAILEFLESYKNESGRLCDSYRDSLNNEIKRLKREINSETISGKVEDFNYEYRLDSEGRSVIEIDEKEKFKYSPRGDKYKIEEIIRFNVEARILGKDLIRLNSEMAETSEEIGFYPRTTLYTWRDNTLRIFYSLFSLNKEDIYKFLSKYDNSKVRAFIDNLKNQVEKSDIKPVVKDDFIGKIELFLGYYTNILEGKNIEETPIMLMEDNCVGKHSSLINELKLYPEIWSSYVSVHSKELLRVIYDDSELLSRCLGVLGKSSSLLSKIMENITSDEKQKEEFFSIIHKDVDLQTKILVKLLTNY